MGVGGWDMMTQRINTPAVFSFNNRQSFIDYLDSLGTNNSDQQQIDRLKAVLNDMTDRDFLNKLPQAQSEALKAILFYYND